MLDYCIWFKCSKTKLCTVIFQLSFAYLAFFGISCVHYAGFPITTAMPKRHFAIQRVHYPWASPGGAEEIFWGKVEDSIREEHQWNTHFFKWFGVIQLKYPNLFSMDVAGSTGRSQRFIFWHIGMIGGPSISHENGHGTRLHGHLLRKFHWKVSKMNESRMVLNITRPCWTLEKFTPKNHHKLVEEKCWRLFIDFVCVGNWMVLFFGGGKGVIKVMVANSKAPCLADFSIHQSQCKTKCWGTHWIQRDKWRWEWRSQ